MARRPKRRRQHQSVFGFLAAIAVSLAACATASPPAVPVAQAPVAAEAVHHALARLPENETLVGLRAAELLARFGEPDLRRAEPPAELWQYRSEDCVLELFLYPKAGTPRVIGSEVYARSRDGTAQCRSHRSEGRQSRL